MYDEIFEKLKKSEFRSRFKLKEKDREYLLSKGFDTIKNHARDFISKRIAPANLTNDGKQTPTKGHPVFTAQHATNMQPPAAAEAVLTNGTNSPKTFP